MIAAPPNLKLQTSPEPGSPPLIITRQTAPPRVVSCDPRHPLYYQAFFFFSPLLSLPQDHSLQCVHSTHRRFLMFSPRVPVPPFAHKAAVGHGDHLLLHDSNPPILAVVLCEAFSPFLFLTTFLWTCPFLQKYFLDPPDSSYLILLLLASRVMRHFRPSRIIKTGLAALGLLRATHSFVPLCFNQRSVAIPELFKRSLSFSRYPLSLCPVLLGFFRE